MLDDPETTRVRGISAMPSHAGVSADEPMVKLDGMPSIILFDFVT
jgi:hypothetical protein